MIIGVCGYGFSGSGAIADLLSSYDNVIIGSKSELSIIYKPDGIDDLKHALVDNPVRYYSSDSAIRRFIQYMKRCSYEFNPQTGGEFLSICNDFIDSLIQVKWSGSTMAHYCQEHGLEYILRQRLARGLRRRFEKHFGPICRPFPPDKEMFYSIMDEEEFVSCVRSFLMRIITALIGGKRKDAYIVIDQLFSADNPEKDMIYFDDAKAIVVSRDPRDLYILSKTTTGMDGRFIPSDNVNDFIVYYKGLMKGNKAKDSDNVLVIRFEDLIYNTENTKRKIEDFLCIQNIKTTSKVFDPKRSINNTQLFIKYPQYRNDIEKIEKELSSLLYNYNEYDVVPTFNTSPF